MISVEKLIQRRPKNPAHVAYDIAARAKGEELKGAAVIWCEAFSPDAHLLIGDLGHNGGDARHAAVFDLLNVAFAGHEVLSPWLARAKANRYLWGAKREETQFDRHLMSAMLALWSHRGRISELSQQIAAWKAKVEPLDAWHVAILLYDFPDIVETLIGPAIYRPPAPGACSGCQQHPRPYGDDCGPHLLIVHKRLSQKIERHRFDQDVLAAIPPQAILYEQHALITSVVQRWLREGLPLPPAWRAAIDDALAQRDANWMQAMLLLCADPSAHGRVIEALELDIRQAPDPLATFRALARRSGFAAHAFAGPGWGRKLRLPKLRPVARALLDRGVWPCADWQKLLRPLERDPGVETDEFEPQREVLAEGLLAVALDDRVPFVRRETALDALALLMPGGDGSWAKALSKVECAELRGRAREVQRALADKRATHLDAELGIADACEAFLGVLPETKS